MAQPSPPPLGFETAIVAVTEKEFETQICAGRQLAPAWPVPPVSWAKVAEATDALPCADHCIRSCSVRPSAGVGDRLGN